MPDLQRKPLIGHSTRSGASIQTGCAVLFGLPFLGAGVFIILLAAGRLPIEKQQPVPPALGALGLVFGGAGLWMIAHGISGFLRNAGVARRRRGRPDEPWHWDHPWDTAGASFGGLGVQVRGWIGLVWFGLFAAPFNWIAWHERGVWMFAAGILDLLVLAGVGFSVYAFLGWIQHGRARLRYGSFPFFLGGPFEAFVEDADRLRGFRSITLRLRCVEEAFEYVNESNRVSCYQLYEDTQELTPATGSIAGEELRVAFALPRGDYGSRLGQHPPRYWELVVSADVPGIDYSATFLVPVYAPPGAARS
jgi:hypothetical protein